MASTIKPFPHQIEATKYLKERNGGFLYIEQRGGKTKPAVTAVLEKDLGERFNVLVITKATCMVVWEREFLLQGVPTDQIVIVNGTQAQRKSKLLQNLPITICNWNMVYEYKVMDQREWGAVIMDESSCVANLSTAVTRYMLRATRRMRDNSIPPMLIALSGNPSPESPIQYATQAIITDGIYFGCSNVVDYITAYWRDNRLKPGVTNKMIMKNPMHATEIKTWIASNCFVRTMEELGLGSQILYSRRYVTMNKEQKTAIHWAIAKKQALGPDIGDKVLIGYLNQIAAGIDPDSGAMINLSKINEVLECYKENPEPTIVFSFFKKPLESAMHMTRTSGFKCALVTGDYPKPYIDSMIDQFQTGVIDILYAQTDLIKMGRDLSRASITYYLSNSFSNDTRDQSVMRTTNILKKTPVEIVDICTLDMLDEKIVDMLVQKETISDEFLIQGILKAGNNG